LEESREGSEETGGAGGLPFARFAAFAPLLPQFKIQTALLLEIPPLRFDRHSLSTMRRSAQSDDTMVRIGIDLGGTKTEGIVLDTHGKESFRKRVDTRPEDGYTAILNRIKSLYDDLRASAGEAAHTFGIGTPGAISPRTGRLKNSNTVCLNGQPLKDDLERLLGRRIEIQNDANCFALAEALHGAGRGKSLVFGVIMGTGCGGGIVHKGEVITGPQAIAGEWGHMSIDPNGPICYCGQRGCVETYISGGGLEARYTERYGVKRSFREIAGDFGRNDPRAVEFMRLFFSQFGRAMANLIDVLDPDVVILGGGVSNFAPLYTDGVAEVARHVFSDRLETPIVKHQLGDSAGVIGAALIGI
jgi:fructokinase